jgi:dihydroorotate dehydrogenase electron transfer subunit
VTGPLSAAREELGEVVAVDHLGGGMVEISARLPHLAAAARPGQFAQLRCGDSAALVLRRPFSVAWTEAEVAAFVLAPVGAGTRVLAAVRPGDALSVIGPLGHGFTVAPRAAHAVCVSGGLGCAPFPLLIRALREAGVGRVTVVSGAASADRLYPVERFARGDAGVTVIETTVDGSAGRRGLVTDALPGRGEGVDALYACGPNPMLAALAVVSRRDALLPPITEVSLEAPMGCGYGTCLGCALPVGGDRGSGAWSLCCREGPVMRLRDVDWDALMALPPAHVA